ncbi:odorant receptor 22a-like isoform X2 [Fopius arisanus]|uniref:Odorant receptor n=1 Tax=Fopius arisanus TaxID=64838 RepID=A0A9R1SUI5_9HYME|nr:PREDICTED: odorant receptor 22a-like isoform X2 [Fopius arisanus]
MFFNIRTSSLILTFGMARKIFFPIDKSYLHFNLQCLSVLVWELADAFNWERHLPGTEEITQYRDTVLTNLLSSSKTFTVSIGSAVIPYFIFSYYAIFEIAEYKLERLPIGVAPMKYSLVSYNFWVAFICDYWTFTQLALTAVIQNAFIMAVMMNVKAQLKILSFRLQRCHIRNYEINNGATDEHPGVIHFECVERQIDEKSRSLDPNKELINCIKFHQEIVRIFRIFKEIYNQALLPQLFIMLLLITVLLLQMVLGKEGNHADAIVALEFLIPVMLQLLTLCWGGNISLVESDKLSNSLYEARWYDVDREFRSNVKIFLGAVKDPLIIRAGGICDLTAVTFKNILSKAYSGVAVLNNMSQ